MPLNSSAKVMRTMFFVSSVTLPTAPAFTALPKPSGDQLHRGAARLPWTLFSSAVAFAVCA